MALLKIAWAMPNYGPIMAPVYTSHMLAVIKACRDMRVDYQGPLKAAGATDRMYTHEAENQCVRDFLASDCTHLFLTESDMILPPNTLPLLASVEQPLVSGVYYLRQGYGQPCLYRNVEQFKGELSYGQSPVRMFPQVHPFRIDGCVGVGCLLVQRRVFETIPPPWFDLMAGREVDGKRIGYGSDMYFAKHVRAAGFETWVHPGVQCEQIEYVVWNQRDYHAAIAADESWLAKGVIIGEGTVGL